MDRYEKTYKEIISFYDFAEELIDTVEHKNVKDPVHQLEFIEPIIEKIELATDSLAEEYRHFIKTGKKPGFLVRRKIAKSLKEIYESLGTCKKYSMKKAIKNRKSDS
jgi:hypothetical protein